MPKKLTNEDFLEKLKLNNIKYVPLEEYLDSQTKIKFICEKGHKFYSQPRQILYGNQGCPYCSGNKVLKGYNDLWTTHPKIAKLLKNKDEGYIYSFGSHKETDWICPICNNVIKKSFHYMSTRNKLCCDNCNNAYMSYPEKYMCSMLEQLGIRYIHDKQTKWSNSKRYDFYLIDYNYIIETNGIQHYKQTIFSKDLNYVIENDKYKKELAFQNGIKEYIEIDCSYSNAEYLKKSILNSLINELFDLSIVDWDDCETHCNKNIITDIVDMWNCGYKINEISHKLNIERHCVSKNLKIGNNVGLCNYNSDDNAGVKIMQNTNCKEVFCIETNETFNSIKEASYKYDISNQCISACCRGERKNSKRFSLGICLMV